VLALIDLERAIAITSSAHLRRSRARAGHLTNDPGNAAGFPRIGPGPLTVADVAALTGTEPSGATRLSIRRAHGRVRGSRTHSDPEITDQGNVMEPLAFAHDFASLGAALGAA